MPPKPVVLCILDGWGLREGREANAPALANTPTMDRLMATCPHSTLVTFGPDVGLPKGQMGNSEVGHTNIGAGRVVAMDLGQIDLAIEDGTFFTNPALGDFIAKVRAAGGAAHLMGVISDGGVHGHILHLLAAARALAEAGLPVVIHAITDGRDVAPSSALTFLKAVEDKLPHGVRIGTVSGRYYAMDRDTRWDRVMLAQAAIVDGQGQMAGSATEAIEAAYAKGETDEFIRPTVIDGYAGARDGDGLFCLNFRADRAREILSALGDTDFTAAERRGVAWSSMLGMVDYSTAHDAYMTSVFPKRAIVNTLGEWVAAQGRTQFRLAETEKYPHVTFFLNGGREQPFAEEDRFMPKSPKVATYDLQPEMSEPEVAAQLVGAIRHGYDLIVVNFANPDMVGHTGILEAAMAACEAVDTGLGQAVAALEEAGGAMLVIADHGNCETMVDPVTGGPHTAHTTNLVPAILVGGAAGARLQDGRLADVAPTLLQLMGLPQPAEMTGKSLIA
ncbi:2,3-bisphosphoglycerate-independent phosphoglycerate mutase [Falsirhodobacter halotolerans]|uniref:2,3-bisphosphoglycerate-independent phosphoglycerate mutase n=1 Tax=Falsirhodobacter halotolerans TaxID=1146892 RepID=UPI001FCFF3E4|nr:2,3-bisphosphoglycerate-independent phosphoglycerate mutase [Falsirhodobacter halotolerans]MCJ8138379.1 2,3-bisphosphoglycerate-independent phosphoglycerate mutase [Falsirhodobacter halotolerans]